MDENELIKRSYYLLIEIKNIMIDQHGDPYDVFNDEDILLIERLREYLNKINKS